MKKFMDKDFLLSTETAKKLYAACENRSEWFWDGVHPNADGAKGIAETITADLKQEKQR